MPPVGEDARQTPAPRTFHRPTAGAAKSSKTLGVTAPKGPALAPADEWTPTTTLPASIRNRSGNTRPWEPRGPKLAPRADHTQRHVAVAGAATSPCTAATATPTRAATLASIGGNAGQLLVIRRLHRTPPCLPC